MSMSKERTRTLDRIRAEFERATRTPSPNPRYGGLTPSEAIRKSKRRGRQRSGCLGGAEEGCS